MLPPQRWQCSWFLLLAAGTAVSINKTDRNEDMCKMPVLTDVERHHLACFLKHQLFDEQGEGRYCCLPKGPQSSSCALVANGGSLLDFTHGEDIDRHDFVIRMNDAPIKNFEKHVGAKASIRLGWNAKPTRANESPEYLSETYPMCEQAGIDSFRTTYQETLPEVRTSPLRCDAGIVLKTFQSLFHNISDKGKGPSTGGMALLLALSSCATLDVYGATPHNNTEAPFHYYGRHLIGYFAGRQHRTWNAEHDLLLRLSETSVHKMQKQGFASFVGLRSVQGCDASHQTHPGFTSRWTKCQQQVHRPSFDVLLPPEERGRSSFLKVEQNEAMVSQDGRVVFASKHLEEARHGRASFFATKTWLIL